MRPPRKNILSGSSPANAIELDTDSDDDSDDFEIGHTVHAPEVIFSHVSTRRNQVDGVSLASPSRAQVRDSSHLQHGSDSTQAFTRDDLQAPMRDDGSSSFVGETSSRPQESSAASSMADTARHYFHALQERVALLRQRSESNEDDMDVDEEESEVFDNSSDSDGDYVDSVEEYDEEDEHYAVSGRDQGDDLEGDQQVSTGMNELLSEMVSGAYRGTDALGQLYNDDKGFNVSKLPLYPATASLRQRGLRTPLHNHQLQGLLWMCHAEHRRHRVNKMTALWKAYEDDRGVIAYRNMATGRVTYKPPVLPRGGINADAMGLGKTLQILALVISDPRRAPRGTRVSKIKPQNSDGEDEGTQTDVSLASSYCSADATEVEKSSDTLSEDSSDTMDTTDSFEKVPVKRDMSFTSPIKTDRKGKGKTRARTPNRNLVQKECRNTTLVICPLSVLQNWTSQIEEHCDENKVRCLKYYGSLAKKIRSSKNFEKVFAKNNVVLTTYDTIRAEYTSILKRRQMNSKGKKDDADLTHSPHTADQEFRSEFAGDADQLDTEDKHFLSQDFDADSSRSIAETPLFTVKWLRIVLDEAHTARNPNTILYRAICELKAERRWAITGTPIVNSTRDLGSLASWIGLHPFNSGKRWWNTLIEKRLKKQDRSHQAASMLLRAIVHSLCLRRHKAMLDINGRPVVSLPDIQYYQHNVALTPADREYYMKCEVACKNRLLTWIAEGRLIHHRAAILEFLLRLRQMSCHQRLIGSKLLESIENSAWNDVNAEVAADGVVILSAETKKELQRRLKVVMEMGDDCPICFEPLVSRQPVITPCAHTFCKECISGVITLNSGGVDPRCPMDRLPLPKTIMGLIEPEEESDELNVQEDLHGKQTSAKVRECLKIIEHTLQNDPTEKILVFSNFVRFLEIIAEELEESRMPFAKFNGSMNVQRRNTVLEHFRKPIGPADVAALKSIFYRLKQKREYEKDASDAHKSGSSLLLSELRAVDFQIPDEATSPRKSSRRKGKSEIDVFGDNPNVLLISMGCGALGLNLTAASTVILMDPWWQSTIEQQAIDRVHRIGQSRDIKVFQMICKSTVEERVLAIQSEKEQIAERAFSGFDSTSGRREKTQTSMRDLVRLFGLDDDTIQSALQVQDPST